MLFSKSISSQVISDFTTITSNTGCGSLVVEFEDLSTGNPNTWLWDFGNGTSSTLQNPVSIYSTPGSYTIKLSVTDGATQDLHTQTDYVKVYNTPLPSISNNSSVFCVPQEVIFVDETQFTNNITSWLWDFGDGGSSVLQNPNYEYSISGLFTVSLSVVDNKGCESLIIFDNLIDAKKVPVTSFSSDIIFSCNNTENVSFINTSNNATNFTWNFGDGFTSSNFNPIHNYASGNFNVSLISSNNICEDTLVLNNFIEVGGEINPDFTSNIIEVCVEEIIDFLDITPSSPDSWLWDFGDGTTSNLQHPTHQFLSSGLFSVSLTTSKNGDCLETIIKTDYITVFDVPNIILNADEDYSCDLPFSVQFSDNTLNAVDWSWIFSNGDSSSMQNPIIDFYSFDQFDVSLVVIDINNCVSEIIFPDFIIVDEVIVDFSVSDSIICESDVVEFFDISNSSLFPLISYNWDFGNGATSILENPQQQFIGFSYFDISFDIENSRGCRKQIILDDFIKTIGPPSSDFSANRIVSCAGSPVLFSDLSTSTDVIADWNWSFGDGNSSLLQNPSNQFNQIGTYDVTLIVGEGKCTDTLVKSNYIEIIEPSSFFVANFNCPEPLKVEFDNLSVGANDVLWDFGDGTTSTDFNPIHIFPNRGSYDVLLRVTNNITMCTHEYVKQIQITIPIASFDYLPLINGNIDSVVCVPRRVIIDNQSQDWRNYQLDWGDGYIGYGRADHLLLSDTVYDLTLSITDKHGCRDTLVRNNMYRSNDVVTNFDVTNIVGCNTLTIDFQDLSSVTSDVVWDFGDGTISNQNNPQHEYNSEGFYDVTLYSVSIEGCKDTLKSVEYIKFIYPEVNFTISDNKICKNDVVSFMDSSKGISLDYNWDFGDGVSSTDKNPLHNFNSVGVFNLTLSITDTFGCVSVHNTLVVEAQEVVADFSSSLFTSNCPPLITSFNNNSTGNIINYNWDFGDGISSNQQSPSHLYSYSGNFNVGLIIEDDFACSDTLVFENLISVFGPTGNFTFSDSLICNSDSVSFVANTENVDSYLWDFGDGVFSVDSNPVHFYSTGNFYHPILIISNSSSCQLIVPAEDSIEVRQVIVDAGLDKILCLGDSVELNAVANASSFIWNNSSYISNTNSQNPLVFPDTSSMFYVTSRDGMCFSSDSVFVVVSDNIPQPNFTSLKNCYLDSMEFFANSGIIASSFDWEWTILGQNLNSQNLFFQFDTLGIYAVELIVTNLDNNCTATVINNVEVLPLPLVDFTSNEVCFGEITIFKNLSASDINTSLWSFGNHFQSSLQMNPSNLFSEAGVFNTTLVVSSENGCLNSITKEVVVHEIPEIEMFVSTQCEGEESQLFATLNSSDSVVWEWSFSDNSYLDSKQFTTHLFPNFGVYDVSLKATSVYSCVANLSATATINPNPQLDFEVIRICEGENTQFINKSTIKQGSIFSYEWSFSESTVSNDKNPSHIFDNPGLHSVLLNVTSNENCSANLERDIVIHSLPQVDFLVDREVCEDDLVNFTNNSLTDGGITFAKWDFGDASFSNDENPIHSFRNSNFYTISLEIETEFGCSGFIKKENFIQVMESPLARFSMSENKVSLLSSEIIFTNFSDENLYFEWDFDNGIINLEDRVVSNSFSETGLFEVLLYVENEFGCKDELIHEVVVEEEFSVFFPTAFTPNNDGLNDVFEVKVNGVYSFEMKIYNRWGEMVYFSDNIDHGWDGKESLSNDVIENGTYLYHIYVTDNNEKPWVYNGELNLMK